MTVNGVDVTSEVGAICGSMWIVFYIALVWFVWTRKPTTLVGRRWKATWLVGGLPVLGIPLTMPIIISGILILQSDPSKFEMAALPEIIPLIFSSSMATVACLAPLSILMAIFAVIGTFYRFRNSLDSWLDKTVPPSKDERHDSETWY
jgi:hypothetical protein